MGKYGGKVIIDDGRERAERREGNLGGGGGDGGRGRGAGSGGERRGGWSLCLRATRVIGATKQERKNNRTT